MAFDEELAQRLRSLIFAQPGLSEKKMFGGLAFMIYGNMCCGVIGDDLIIRVSPNDYEELLARPGAREFDFSGRPMRGWVYVSEEVLSSEEELLGWVEAGLDYATKLPKK